MKYHQSGVQPEYEFNEGTGCYELSNNWNPDQNYGTECARVYFRIDARKFNNMTGYFEDLEDNTDFNNEVENLFASFGWSKESPCGEWFDYKNNEVRGIHVHPQSISGTVRKNSIKKITESLNKCNTFRVEWVDLYETIYVMTDDEYKEYLDTKKSDIQEFIFKSAHTTRTYKYYNRFDVENHVARTFCLKRLDVKATYPFSDKFTLEYVDKIVEEMIEEGCLILYTKDNVDYIRSLNKTEQKKFKKKSEVA